MKNLLKLGLLLIAPSVIASSNFYAVPSISYTNATVEYDECVVGITPGGMGHYKWLAVSGMKSHQLKGETNFDDSSQSLLKGNSDYISRGQGSLDQFLTVISNLYIEPSFYPNGNRASNIRDNKFLENFSNAQKEMKLNVSVKDNKGTIHSRVATVNATVHARTTPSIDASALSISGIGQVTDGISFALTVLTLGGAPLLDNAIHKWNNTVEKLGKLQRIKKRRKIRKVTEKQINDYMTLLITEESLRLLDYSCADNKKDIKRKQLSLVKFLSKATNSLNSLIVEI